MFCQHCNCLRHVWVWVRVVVVMIRCSAVQPADLAIPWTVTQAAPCANWSSHLTRLYCLYYKQCSSHWDWEEAVATISYPPCGHHSTTIQQTCLFHFLIFLVGTLQHQFLYFWQCCYRDTQADFACVGKLGNYLSFSKACCAVILFQWHVEHSHHLQYVSRGKALQKTLGYIHTLTCSVLLFLESDEKTINESCCSES